MKKRTATMSSTFIIFACSYFSGYSQQFTPVFKRAMTPGVTATAITAKLVAKAAVSAADSSATTAKLAKVVARGHGTTTTSRESIFAETASINAKAQVKAAATAAATARETGINRVVFYGATALSGASSDIAKTITASGQLLVSANIIGNLTVNLGANLLNVNPSKTKKDSVDFNSLMFPETGNFGFLVHPSYKITFMKASNTNNEYALIPFYEFAYRKVSIDSPQAAFKIYNHTVGAGFQWNYHPDDSTNFTFNASVYYHWFNIPVEDVKKFTSLVNDTLFEKAAIHNDNILVKSMGIKFTVQYNSFIFFADFRKNFRTSILSDNDPFKGGSVNIGFQTNFKIKAF